MTAPVTPTPIVAYSGTLPDPSDPTTYGTLPDPSDPTTYGTRGRALWAWEVGALFNGINLIATQTNTNAVSAAESAEAAMLASSATMWSAATNYATGAVAKSPTDMQSYSRNAPGGVDATDPAASASWTLVGAKFLKKAGDVGVGSQSFATGGYLGKDQYMGNFPSSSNAYTPHDPVFQNLNAAASTYVGVSPSSGGSGSGWYAKSSFGSTSLWGGLFVNAGGVDIHSSHSNTPSVPVPINFKFSGTTKATISPDGSVSNTGTKGRQGTGGTSTGNILNFWWTGSALTAYVDGSSVGNVTLTSDYRIKRDVRPMEQTALERIAALRPVLYRYADHEALGAKAEDREREGFIAHELADVIPSAVEGEKDAPNQIQSLRIDALVAVLVKAVQEQQVQIAELQRRLALLEG